MPTTVRATVEEAIQQSKAYESQGETAQAWKSAQGALELAKRSADQQGQALALLQIAHIEVIMGSWKEAAGHAREALALADPETPEIVRAWTIQGNCQAYMNNLDKAEAIYRKALDLARRFGTPEQRLVLLHNLANSIYLIRGQFDLGLSHELEALRLSKQYDLKPRLYLSYITLNRIYLSTGRFEEMRAAIAEWQAYEPTSEADLGYRYLLSAWLALADGEPDTALDFFLKSLARAEMYGEPGWLGEIYQGMSQSRRKLNDRASARDWVSQAIKLAQAIPSQEMIGLALTERGRIAWEEADEKSALEDFMGAAEYLEQGGCLFARAQLGLLHAILLHQTGSGEASPAFKDAGQRILGGNFLFLLDQERRLAFPWLAQHLDHPDPGIAELASRLLEALLGFPAPALQVKTLGGLVLRLGARKLKYADLRARRAGELLGLLLSTPGHSLSSEQAIEALLPECDPEAGQVVLYKAVSELRRALEPELPDRRFTSRYLETADSRVALRLPPGSWIDFKRFRACIRRNDWEGAVGLYAGECLPEYRYAEWVHEFRESLAQDFRTALFHLAEQHLVASCFSQALELARKLLALDPWHEAAALIAMRACQALDDPVSGLRIYHRLEKTLGVELGLEPGEDLQQFALSLKKRR